MSTVSAKDGVATVGAGVRLGDLYDALQEHGDEGATWLARSWALVHPWGSGGVYLNFPDPDLPDWALAYYGENYDRVLRVKALYDPENFFRFPQSLPVA